MTRPTRTTATLTFSRVQFRRTPDQAAELVAGCTPCELAALAAADREMATGPAAGVRWEGAIGIEGEVTGDGRMIEPNALRWDTLPMPLRYAPEDNGGHGGAVVVGRILTLERRDDEIWATGDIDTGSDAGMEYARQLREGLTTGISMDLDDVSFEIRVAMDILEEEQQIMEEGPADAAEDNPTDAEGRVTVLEIDADDEIMVTTDARIRAATGVAIPAFERARIALAADTDEMSPEPDEDEDLAASGTVRVLAASGVIPVAPPAAWFGNPGLDGPTPVTVTEDGRIYGHIAIWGTCHTGHPNQCVTPPRSRTGYAYFRTGALLTAEGTEVTVGRITMDTLHAAGNLSAAETIRHYEDTGRVAADVAAGEDDHGIWIAGALRPNLTAEQVRALRAAPFSGDWRRQGGNLELVAALGVNVPGFPVLRPQGLVASGAMQSLVASGMILPDGQGHTSGGGQLTVAELGLLRRAAARERTTRDREVHAAALALRVRRTHQMTGR